MILPTILVPETKAETSLAFGQERPLKYQAQTPDIHIIYSG